MHALAFRGDASVTAVHKTSFPRSGFSDEFTDVIRAHFGSVRWSARIDGFAERGARAAFACGWRALQIVRCQARAARRCARRRTCRPSCADERTRTAGTLSARSRSGNRPQPMRLSPHRVAGTASTVFASCSPLSVQTTRIHNRLGVMVSAKHNEQVGDHRRLALLVELDDLLLG